MNTFEAMLGAEVYLLGLGDLFEEVLYDNSIIVASFAATHQSLKQEGGRTHLGVISMW